MLRLLVLSTALFFMMSLKANPIPTFHQVEALPGDGIYSLLRRFQLDKHSCNFDQFYSLNKIKRNTRLIKGRTYSLPLMVYTFNGKTIRSSIGVDDWNLAINIQKYNETMESEGVRNNSFKKDMVLWVPYHLLNCPEPDLEIPPLVIDNPEAAPAASGDRQFPIFGPKYAYTPLASNKLKGKVFYVVGGHGGPDPGAMGKRGNYTLCEDEYAYDVALRLCRNLISHGATAYMINRDPNDGIRDENFFKCDNDEVLWGDIKMAQGQKTRLFQRSDIINELYEKHRLQGVTEQLAIMIHVDSRNKGVRTDLFFYHHPDNEEGKKKAQNMLKAVQQQYKKYQQDRQYEGTVTARDLHMLRECLLPAVYIELANIRNTNDQQRIIVQRNRQLLADWFLLGILN
ncbi:MAG: N-acetylmuramoyl-L-alanine amidase [Saprospiraceae bacterium]